MPSSFQVAPARPAPPFPYCDNFAAPRTPAEEYSSERRGGRLTPSLAERPVQPPSPRSAPPRRFPRPVRRGFCWPPIRLGCVEVALSTCPRCAHVTNVHQTVARRAEEAEAPTRPCGCACWPNRHSGGGVLSLVLEAGSPRAAAGSTRLRLRTISGLPQGLASRSVEGCVSSKQTARVHSRCKLAKGTSCCPTEAFAGERGFPLRWLGCWIISRAQWTGWIRE